MEKLCQALQVIDDVTNTADKVWLNKSQCKRLVERFSSIGQLVNVLQNGPVDDEFDDSSKKMYPAFDELLTVLKKGEALISGYKDWNAITNALSRTDNREAFKEIHGEIDSLKAHFYFDKFGNNEDFGSTVGEQRDGLLTSDAEEDRQEMSMQLQPKREGIQDLEEVKLVVSEKLNLEDHDDLPSYLRINPDSIETRDPIRPRERRSHADPLDALALVHSGNWLSCKFAIKVFKSKEASWNRDRLLKEVGSLIKLRHPHIVQLIGFAEASDRSYLLMELMDGSLRHIISGRNQREGVVPFMRSEVINIITQIAKGMYFLHRQGYIHGELKCSNVLVKESSHYLDVKISDFYCSRELKKPSSGERTKSHRPRWTAPEALPNASPAQDEPTDSLLQKGDVYSFGMTCYEVVTGKLPFQDVFGSELVRKIKAGDRPELPSDLGDGLEGLINICWHPEPQRRPTFEEICHRLDYIRSSEPLMIVKSSGIQKVLARFREIPLITGVLNKFSFPVHEREQGANFEWTKHEENQENRLEKSSSIAKGNIPKYLTIDPSDLKPVRKIGKGGSANVYEANWLGCKFAVKRFKTSAPIPVLQKEMDFLIKLLHPHIVRLVGFAVDPPTCMIVMECMNMDLSELINSRLTQKQNMQKKSRSTGPFRPGEALDIITKIAVGMEFLHSRGVMHRDLKALNVLVRNEHTGNIDVKIVDFGVSQYIGDSPMRGVGTGFWRAPEILQALKSGAADQPTKYNLKAADVYSFAMTCYEVLTGAKPFEGVLPSNYEPVLSGQRPMIPSSVGSDLEALIKKCWHKDPEQRPDFSQICKQLAETQVPVEFQEPAVALGRNLPFLFCAVIHLPLLISKDELPWALRSFLITDNVAKNADLLGGTGWAMDQFSWENNSFCPGNLD